MSPELRRRFGQRLCLNPELRLRVIPCRAHRHLTFLLVPNDRRSRGLSPREIWGVIFDLFGTLVYIFSRAEYDRVLGELAAALSVPAR